MKKRFRFVVSETGSGKREAFCHYFDLKDLNKFKHLETFKNISKCLKMLKVRRKSLYFQTLVFMVEPTAWKHLGVISRFCYFICIVLVLGCRFGFLKTKKVQVRGLGFQKVQSRFGFKKNLKKSSGFQKSKKRFRFLPEFVLR